jgi:molybdate transport system ATP-binding protein
MPRPLIELHHVDVALNRTTVLRDLSWRLLPGEQWAVLGANGSGKSTFLKLIRGELRPLPGNGRCIYRIDGMEQATAVSVKERISVVSPELQDRYLQQEWRLKGWQVVCSGFRNGDYLYEPVNKQQKRFVEKIVDLLGISSLLRRNVQQLSTGELRKVLIARALAGKPAVIALDEACDGLDVTSRKQMIETLERVARSGTQLLLTTHRSEEIISLITHLLVLENGRITASGPKASVPLPQFSARIRPTINGAPAAVRRAPRKTTTLLRIEQADVFLERKKVLHGINWKIESDQHWAIFGKNGAGKSTLLKLAFGDTQAAWGGRISRFEFTAKNTVWQVKRKIGYLAPELQANYRRDINGTEVVGSGFHSSIGLHERLSAGQRRKISALLKRFGVAALGRKSALDMSYGELRKLLLLRAVVHDPEILICDEPFDGLDAGAKAEFSEALEVLAQGEMRLVLVTHYVGEIPDCISHGLLLEKGIIVVQGGLEEVRAHPVSQRLLVKDENH